MRLVRIVAIGVGVLAAGSGVWIVGGNAIAAKREREASRSLESAFGSRAALAAKYALAVSNADAKRAEVLSSAVGYDLALRQQSSARSSSSVPEAERAAVSGFVTAQVSRGDSTVEAPPPAVAAALASHRVALSALEDALATGDVPRWACNPAVSYEARLSPNGLGHIQVQRLLIADALASIARGENGTAARALEASWKLNEGLASRPEVVAQLLAIAVARLEVGALRKIGVSAEVWTSRLAAMGSRARLIEANLLEREDPADGHYRDRLRGPGGSSWWGQDLLAAIEEPTGRIALASYAEAFGRWLVEVRDEPAFREPAQDPAPGRDTTSILMAISVPNIHETFRRSDRLALEAELTEKVLHLKAARAASGAWPPPSAELAASRFPSLGWNYRMDGDAMTITLDRELPSPKAGLVLPTSFSSRVLSSQ